MSAVTMCDFCGATSRLASEMKKVKLPAQIVPETLTGIGAQGDERVFDACAGCQEELRLLIDSLVARRLGIPDHDIDFRCPACGSDHVRVPGAPHALPGVVLDPSQVTAECGACQHPGTIADFTKRTAEHG